MPRKPLPERTRRRSSTGRKATNVATQKPPSARSVTGAFEREMSRRLLLSRSGRCVGRGTSGSGPHARPACLLTRPSRTGGPEIFLAPSGREGGLPGTLVRGVRVVPATLRLVGIVGRGYEVAHRVDLRVEFGFDQLARALRGLIGVHSDVAHVTQNKRRLRGWLERECTLAGMLRRHYRSASGGAWSRASYRFRCPKPWTRR